MSGAPTVTALYVYTPRPEKQSESTILPSALKQTPNPKPQPPNPNHTTQCLETMVYALMILYRILLEADPVIVVSRAAVKQDDIPIGEQTVSQVSRCVIV